MAIRKPSQSLSDALSYASGDDGSDASSRNVYRALPRSPSRARSSPHASGGCAVGSTSCQNLSPIPEVSASRKEAGNCVKLSSRPPGGRDGLQQSLRLLYIVRASCRGISARNGAVRPPHACGFFAGKRDDQLPGKEETDGKGIETRCDLFFPRLAPVAVMGDEDHLVSHTDWYPLTLASSSLPSHSRLSFLLARPSTTTC